MISNIGDDEAARGRRLYEELRAEARALVSLIAPPTGDEPTPPAHPTVEMLRVRIPTPSVREA